MYTYSIVKKPQYVQAGSGYQKLMAKLNTYGDFNSSPLLINVAASLPCNYTLHSFLDIHVSYSIMASSMQRYKYHNVPSLTVNSEGLW